VLKNEFIGIIKDSFRSELKDHDVFLMFYFNKV